MEKRYEEYLENEFENSLKEFELVKKEIVKDIEGMTVFSAENLGGACASNIDRITKVASKVINFAENIRIYKHYNKAANK